MTNSGPFAEKSFIEIKGRRMAYIDEGEGDPIVFQHGNPTSSYLWRKVMPSCRGLGRLIACDLIGMGDSDKLPNSGPDRYTYFEQREFLFALWEELGIRERVVLVVHDWGGPLGFDWARHHPEGVQGIAYMETMVKPMALTDYPAVIEDASIIDTALKDVSIRDVFAGFRSPAGEDMILRDNIFLEKLLLESEEGNLTEADIAEYRRPFLTPGEDRRPTLTWPRQLPFDGQPPDVVEVVAKNAEWMQASPVPKLWIKGHPGGIMTGTETVAFCERVPNQTSVTVKGFHYLQESSGPEIGAALAEFVRGLRGQS
jgi:haloalkane dehalogenase